jgi:hypothetical protein
MILMMFINKSKIMLVDSNDVTQLTEEDFENVFCDKKYKKDFIKLNGVIYHKKDRLGQTLLNELVGENVSEYFNLQTVKSIIAMSSSGESISKINNYVLLTKLFTNKNNKYDTYEIFTESKYYEDVGLDNLDRLQTIYPLDVRKDILVDEKDKITIIRDFKKLLVRDFMTDQTDRTSSNFTLQYCENHIELMPVFDYEHSFGDYYGYYRNHFFHIFDFDLRLLKVIEYARKDEYLQELLHLAMDLDMSRRIQMLEDEYCTCLTDNEKEKYNSVIKKNKSLIREHKLLR